MIICQSFNTSLHPNKIQSTMGIQYFYISHNNDNDGNNLIYMYLAYGCSGSIWPEDLLVGKISDNDVLTNAHVTYLRVLV
jgi:hypothetical protein